MKTLKATSKTYADAQDAYDAIARSISRFVGHNFGSMGLGFRAGVVTRRRGVTTTTWNLPGLTIMMQQSDRESVGFVWPPTTVTIEKTAQIVGERAA